MFVLGFAVLLASVIPARRASGVEPIVALGNGLPYTTPTSTARFLVEWTRCLGRQEQQRMLSAFFEAEPAFRRRLQCGHSHLNGCHQCKFCYGFGPSCRMSTTSRKVLKRVP